MPHSLEPHLLAIVSARQILALRLQLGQLIKPRHLGRSVVVQTIGEVALSTLGTASVVGETVLEMCTRNETATAHLSLIVQLGG